MSFAIFHFLFLSLVVMLGSGCTYSIHQVPVSDFRPYTNNSNGTPIESRAKQFVVLGFASETLYVDQAYLQLQNQCKDGIVTGIATKYYTEHGFFSWTNHIVMQGLCVRSQLGSS